MSKMEIIWFKKNNEVKAFYLMANKQQGYFNPVEGKSELLSNVKKRMLKEGYSIV